VIMDWKGRMSEKGMIGSFEEVQGVGWRVPPRIYGSQLCEVTSASFTHLHVRLYFEVNTRTTRGI
jgi:hypothetical protein